MKAAAFVNEYIGLKVKLTNHSKKEPIQMIYSNG